MARRFTCSASRRGGGRLLTLAFGTLLAGCELPPAGGLGAATQPANRQRGPVLAQQRRTYADLASGRFISLADFETRGQDAMFRVVGPDGTEGDREQPSLSILRSRNETGAGGLKARLGGTEDRLLFDGERSDELALVRDWRPYGLLLMSVYGPSDGVLLELSIRSGGKDAALTWSRTVAAQAGWNLLRIDLAGVGERIDLGDVRAIGWRAFQAAAPVELFVDDVILADNRADVLVAQPEPGALYVFTRGRRIYVGARERFELAFADGLIAAWRSGDEGNLVHPDGLGPWPVPLAEDWALGQAALAYDDPQLFASWGPAAAATQRVVESTPFRVVIEGRWLFPAADPPATRPADKNDGGVGHVWRYTIYPCGTVYVRVRSVAPASGWSAPRVGYAAAVDGRRGFRRVEPAALAGPDTGSAAAPFVLLARQGPRADLLWTWPQAGALPRQREFGTADERRVAVIAGEAPAGPVVETVHLLRFWPADIDAAPEARSLVGDYVRPMGLVPTAGELLTSISGDLDADGYNEAEGCYELIPAGGVLRVELDPGGTLRYDPLLRVHESAGRRCWVYARGRLITEVGRDGADNLLVSLGRVLSSRTLVEVHTAPPE
ncbi:MAG: hypothetical protein AB1716_02375 [Planctomycetota bacterium]